MNLAPSKHPWWTGVLLLLASAGLVPSAPAQGLKVTLLGTGSPGPSMDRFGPSILVEAGKQKMLFDCGRGATQRIEQNKVPFTEEQHELPPDVANGLLFTLIKHIHPKVPQTTVSMVATTPKPRVVELEIVPEGEKAISSGNTKHETVRYVVKVKIEGMAGLVAPLLGKQPPDTHVWVLTGNAPAFVKFQGPLYDGGPIWRIELATPAGF